MLHRTLASSSAAAKHVVHELLREVLGVAHCSSLFEAKCIGCVRSLASIAHSMAYNGHCENLYRDFLKDVAIVTLFALSVASQSDRIC